MDLPVDSATAIVFDLDDTLYRERDYVDSGFRAVLNSVGHEDDGDLLAQMWRWQRAGEPVMTRLTERLAISADASELLDVYRFHAPDIKLRDGVARLIGEIRSAGGSTGLVTDGRSRTQRAKIAALGLDSAFDAIVISEEVGSEKPNSRNFQLVESRLANCRKFTFIADNPRKDFFAPNELGWRTIQLDDDGSHVHRQDGDLPPQCRAWLKVSDLCDLYVLRL